MAVTSIWAVKARLDKLLHYVGNPEKTKANPDAGELEKLLHYAADPLKTERLHLVSGVNCNANTALEEMEAVKKFWSKTNGRAAYHGYQSFAPGEVTPDEAHRMGVELAGRMWGGRFQVVVATHTDHEHIHNHFCVNPVSFADGKKFINRKQDYRRFRELSDTICREYGKSVIENPKRRGKHYAERIAEKEGRPTVRGRLAAELDEIIKRSFNLADFYDHLRKAGYIVRKYPSRKYATVQPPFSASRFRLDNIRGEDFTEAAISERIRQNRSGIVAPPKASLVRRKRPKRILMAAKPRIRLTGYRALYFRYLYILGKLGQPSTPPIAHRAVRGDVIRLKQLKEQFRFLDSHHICNAAELDAYGQNIDSLISAMTDHRRTLYPIRKRGKDTGGEIERITSQLNELRKERTILRHIRKDAPEIDEKLRLFREAGKKKERERSLYEKKKQRSL